jgi:hypothetical protein
MEGIITYLSFMGVIIVFTRIIFQIRSDSTIEVKKSVDRPAEQAIPGQGYWDYLLVTGMGAIVLIVIFLTNI